MSNLLAETRSAIKASGHMTDDIVFIGSEPDGYECTWDEFCVLANQEYDEGFGAQEVAKDLVMVFRDGAKMWRHEYDGSENWEFSTPFKRPTKATPIKFLFGKYWADLSELHSTDPDTINHQHPR